MLSKQGADPRCQCRDCRENHKQLFLIALLLKPMIKLLMQLTHLIRRFHRMPIHEPLPEGTLKHKAEYPSHERRGQQAEGLHFPRRQRDLPGCDRTEVIPDLTAGHPASVFPGDIPAHKRIHRIRPPQASRRTGCRSRRPKNKDSHRPSILKSAIHKKL